MTHFYKKGYETLLHGEMTGSAAKKVFRKKYSPRVRSLSPKAKFKKEVPMNRYVNVEPMTVKASSAGKGILGFGVIALVALYIFSKMKSGTNTVSTVTNNTVSKFVETLKEKTYNTMVRDIPEEAGTQVRNVAIGTPIVQTEAIDNFTKGLVGNSKFVSMWPAGYNPVPGFRLGSNIGISLLDTVFTKKFGYSMFDTSTKLNPAVEASSGGGGGAREYIETKTSSVSSSTLAPAPLNLAGFNFKSVEAISPGPVKFNDSGPGRTEVLYGKYTIRRAS